MDRCAETYFEHYGCDETKEQCRLIPDDLAWCRNEVESKPFYTLGDQDNYYPVPAPIIISDPDEYDLSDRPSTVATFKDYNEDPLGYIVEKFGEYVDCRDFL